MKFKVGDKVREYYGPGPYFGKLRAKGMYLGYDTYYVNGVGDHLLKSELNTIISFYHDTRKVRVIKKTKLVIPCEILNNFDPDKLIIGDLLKTDIEFLNKLIGKTIKVTIEEDKNA